jgi:dephospho-CoA kinase
MIMNVGLTGGIGSGKTLVGRIFQRLGVPLFNADDCGRELLDTDPGIQTKVLDLFGSGVYDSNGRMNRSLISEIVFKNPDLLAQLNRVVHPGVFERYEEWVLEQSAFPYVIMEAAILFESGADSRMDMVIAVAAPRELRIQRVVERDGVDRDHVVERIRNQWPESQIMEKSHYVIQNDGHQMIVPQVLEIHKSILKQVKQ